jgi:hypothetical protein
MHRARSHAALLDRLAQQARHRFVDAMPAWDPTRSDVDARADLGRGLLDCYALALHVLWTYQHAWAEEGFLTTAHLPASTQRLLGLIGYRPDPGTAAVGLQHFRCKEGTSTILPPGFRVRANPEGTQQAAVFETLRAATVSSVLNELRPYLPQPAVAPVSTVGAIAVVADLAAPEVSVPPPQDVLEGGSLAGQLADRLAAARNGSLAQRNAARARQKALQLAEVARSLQEQGAADACAATFEALCAELCQAQDLANQVPVATSAGPLSEAQELLVGQLARLTGRRPDAIAALGQALARQTNESDAQWSARLDQMSGFLEALVTGLLQEARDQVVRLRGSRALTQLDRAYGDSGVPTLEVDRGIAPPGQDALYLLPTVRDPERGPETQAALLRPGDWLVVGEDIERLGPDGEVVTERRYREAIRIVRIRDEIPAGDREPMTQITFHPPLTRRYQLSRTVLLGNMVQVSHGATVLEEGVELAPDGQVIPLAQGPLTWLHTADPQVPEGRVPQVQLRVADQDWLRVDDLRGQAPTAPVFTAEVTPEGSARLRLGDSREGAAVPARAHIAITYRIGVGPDGNRPGGAITTLASADAAIVSTFNPLLVSGGVAPEESELAGGKATAGIHALSRAISEADVRALALTFGRVRRAQVFRDPVRRREHLTVVVYGVGGEALTDDELQALRTFLANRTPPGIQVTVENCTTVPVRAQLRLHITPGSDPIAVMREVRLRLGIDTDATSDPGLLHADRVDLGRDVQLSDFYGALAGVEHLEAVFVELLYRADAAPTRSDRIVVAPRQVPVWATTMANHEPLHIRWEEARDL